MRWLLLSFAFLWAQQPQIVQRLIFDRKEPPPLYFTYQPATKGIAIVSRLSRRSSRGLQLRLYTEHLLWKQPLTTVTKAQSLLGIHSIGKYLFLWYQKQEGRNLTYFYDCYDYEGTPLVQRGMLFQGTIGKRENPYLWVRTALNRKWLVVAEATLQPANTDKETLFIKRFHVNNPSLPRFSITLEEKDINTEVLDIAIDNQGTIYVLIRHFSPRKKQTVQYWLYHYYPEQQQLKKIALPKPRITISRKEMIIRTTKNNDVLIGGFYSEGNRSEIDGYFFMKIAKDSVVINQAHTLPPELIRRYLSKRAVRKGKSVSTFYLDGTVPTSQDGLVLLAEEFYISYYHYQDAMGRWLSETIYNYGDIWVLSLTPQGTLQWYSIIAKLQSGSIQKELSYVVFASGPYLHFFYKDYRSQSGTNVYYQRVDVWGNTTPPQPFIQGFANSDLFLRSFSFQLNSREGILAYYKRRGRRFILLRLYL